MQIATMIKGYSSLRFSSGASEKHAKKIDLKKILRELKYGKVGKCQDDTYSLGAISLYRVMRKEWAGKDINRKDAASSAWEEFEQILLRHKQEFGARSVDPIQVSECGTYMEKLHGPAGIRVMIEGFQNALQAKRAVRMNFLETLED